MSREQMDLSLNCIGEAYVNYYAFCVIFLSFYFFLVPESVIVRWLQGIV